MVSANRSTHHWNCQWQKMTSCSPQLLYAGTTERQLALRLFSSKQEALAAFGQQQMHASWCSPKIVEQQMQAGCWCPTLFPAAWKTTGEAACQFLPQQLLIHSLHHTFCNNMSSYYTDIILYVYSISRYIIYVTLHTLHRSIYFIMLCMLYLYYIVCIFYMRDHHLTAGWRCQLSEISDAQRSGL